MADPSMFWDWKIGDVATWVGGVGSAGAAIAAWYAARVAVRIADGSRSKEMAEKRERAEVLASRILPQLKSLLLALDAKINDMLEVEKQGSVPKRTIDGLDVVQKTTADEAIRRTAADFWQMPSPLGAHLAVGFALYEQGVDEIGRLGVLFGRVDPAVLLQQIGYAKASFTAARDYLGPALVECKKLTPIVDP